MFLMAPVTAVWGALMFGEPFGTQTVVGLALGLLAVAVVHRGDRHDHHDNHSHHDRDDRHDRHRDDQDRQQLPAPGPFTPRRSG